jgi:hypothetical protein
MACLAASIDVSVWKDGNKLDTLAAAHAEVSDFDKAVEWQEKANRPYSKEEKNEWGKLLDRYRARKPYRADH